ncbi:glucosamine--fructose-6-phosphate aminotransferase [isomerizing] [Clostridium sp. CAG:356]|nr:MAG: glutamine--fructose-6-phosphate aminotransferase [Clostridium sp. 28_12]CDD37819.1 glucosamine--fructose-6-phosphate aminotransferase [isomerizing] [Clostridium sp. CAG:356]
MCGIIGYIGHKKASPILLNGLLRLEYRGYDSAGISTVEKNGLSIMKDKGRVKNLYNLDGIDDLTGTIGIAHTRWATHGKPSKENAHPHLDNSDSFAVVHNGIIENYNELKKFLADNGYTFRSQTDSELIPNLIHYYYSKDEQNDNQKVLRAVQKTCMDLKGSFALQVISKFMPDNMIVIRKDSPLVIGKGDGENYVSSDIPTILSYTKDFYLLNDYEFAVLSRDNVEFYDINLNKIVKPIKSIDWDINSADKNGYEDYMLKEIFEQPNAVRETIGSRLPENEHCNFEDLKFTKEFLLTINKMYIVACGTAMHAGLSGKSAIEKLCNIPVTVDIASEFRYRNPIIDKNTLCIYISQSGETADTIAALKLAKSKGATTLAISNVIGSSITREADYCIYTHAGPEIAVASTKAYTSQVVLLDILAVYFAEILGTTPILQLQNIKKEILALPAKIDEALKCSDRIKTFANKIYQEKDIFFLGRGADYNTALEGSLKLKEISYIHSEAYAAGELKHGPIALIENGITVIGIMTDKLLVEKSISNLQEVITRGAKTLVVTNQNLPANNFETIITVPDTDTLLSPILAIVPLQLLSYYISKAKGLDVDKPRNLAKSVTVE